MVRTIQAVILWTLEATMPLKNDETFQAVILWTSEATTPLENGETI